MSMTSQMWVRTWKRKPGVSFRSYDPSGYRPGPWHLERSERGYENLTWCGRDPARTTMNVERRERTDPPEAWVRSQGPEDRGKDKVCSACCTALATGSPKPYKYTGKGHRA